MASGVILIGDSEFDHVVKAIEVHYHTKRTHIPFLGVANLVVKVAHPAGASEFKLAVFDDLKAIDDRDERELDQFMQRVFFQPPASAGARTLPAAMANAIYIYADDDEARSTRMLIATFQRDQATVVAG